MFIKVSVAHCSYLVIFYFKEKLCVSAVTSASLWLGRCSLSKAFRKPCSKNRISSYIWHKSFIQTVKCSFFNQIIVYQSFYHTLLTFSYFLTSKVLCFGTSRKNHLRDVYEAFRRPCWKNYIRFCLTQIIHSNG